MTHKEINGILAQARAMDIQRMAFDRARGATERFPDPAICESCGYPLAKHPRSGCAFVDGYKP